MSGGERKRVSIGIEMLAEPAVIILDEPTSGLDAATAAMLIETLRDIATNEGRTVGRQRSGHEPPRWGTPRLNDCTLGERTLSAHAWAAL